MCDVCRGAGPAHALWWRAAELGSRGHYAAAATVLRDLRTDPHTPPALRAHAAVTRASHLRQLGGHRLAATLDGEGLRLARAAVPAGGHLAVEAVADALVGLAADAVGRWDAGTARRLLDRAEPWCDGGGRTRVRWSWVRAETSLLDGDPGSAVTAAEDAVRGARDLGSERHLLKSRLLRAVAASVAVGSGPDDGGLAELDAVADAASAAGLLPLSWAARLAAADAAKRPRADPDGDPGPPGTPMRPNERHARTSRLNTLSRRTDAERRRHAAAATLSVIYLRTDPLGRRSVRESAWIPAPIAVP